ncbi:hypothetical protein B0H13DRAFT_2423107 [Mycena leptocephala]|nr:hypothetical protein B0H13DRAFT_2423107 [Mycena leptocephala]
MDPITITTTLITFSSFIKDLIEIGQSIQSSIEKVGENRRRIRELTKDVLHTLADLANLTRGQEDTFQVPALLSALGNLKAEMLHVLSMCYKISPGVGSQIKVWMKRDDLEKKIGHLKEHVNKCYLQFTAFSAARIEQTTARIEDTSVQVAHTTLRVEQTLVVNNVENQVRLCWLEGMMARVLLETQFGQNVLNQTIEAISSDLSHKKLESQYLSVTMQLIEHIQKLSAGGNLVLKTLSWDSTTKQILLEFNEGCTSIETDFMRGVMANLGVDLAALGMTSESMAWELLKIQIFRRFTGNTEINFNMSLPYKPASNLSISGIISLKCRKAFFVLANALSSFNRHLESYAAFMEGFQTTIELPVSERPLVDKDIDSFINQICKMAEEDQFSLVMLADCVILYCNLARIHPEEFSSQFLWLLHAYAHFSHQDNSDLSLKNLRIFLEPNSDCPPPWLDRAVHIDDFNAHGGIIKDVVWAFYTCPSHSTVALIRNIFITHFDQANIILQEVVDNSDPKLSTIQWALYSIIGIIPFVSGANKMVLLQILSRTVKHTNDILTCQGSHWQWWLSEIHGPIFRHLWRAGLLEDALAELEQRLLKDYGGLEWISISFSVTWAGFRRQSK